MIIVRLKEIRIQKGLKQKDIANILNVQQAAISKYEKGIVSLTQEQIIILSLALDITPNELLSFDEAYKKYSDYLISLTNKDVIN